jgi:type IV secretion system protein VirB4
LLDGAADTLAFSDVMHFEMDGLMQVKPLVLPVLTYLFHRLEARSDGRPTLLVLDEAWLFLDDPLFAARIREWLKTLRKKNVAVVFATQSLADIERSSIAPALLESCPTRIFLPNDRAVEPQAATVYERFGLNQRQIEIIARATPKRDYYAQTARGNRQFELGLGPVALAFAAAASPDDQRLIDRCAGGLGSAAFAIGFLRAKGLAWAADLLDGLQSGADSGAPKPPPPPREVGCREGRVIKPAAALLNTTAVGVVLAAQPAAVSERLSPFRIPPAKPKRTRS